MIVKIIFLIALLNLSLNQLSYAASENECAIWLCLPTGFPPGCGDAKSALKKRIKKLKSPLPSLSSCKNNNKLISESENIPEEVKNEINESINNLNYVKGKAIKYNFKDRCNKWRYKEFDADVCISWEIDKTGWWYSKGSNESMPYPNCSRLWTTCLKTASYIQILQNNQFIGSTSRYFVRDYYQDNGSGD